MENRGAKSQGGTTLHCLQVKQTREKKREREKKKKKRAEAVSRSAKAGRGPCGVTLAQNAKSAAYLLDGNGQKKNSFCELDAVFFFLFFFLASAFFLPLPVTRLNEEEQH